MKALPLLLAVLATGATVSAIDTQARDRTMLQPLPSPESQVSGDVLGSLGRADAWLNSRPLTQAGLRGKVVLVQFWTYTCINWIRTAPYVRAWADKYKDQGLVVIGVHAPEFPFEKDLDNVRRAVRDLNIGYPVAVDNGHAIWRAFDNNYWPALYFIDARGRVRHHKCGEGDYQESERVIQELLAEGGATGVLRDLVSVEGGERKPRPTGATFDRRRTTSASTEPVGLRLPAVRQRAGSTAMRHPLASRSTNGLLRASGRCEAGQSPRAEPRERFSTGFTLAIFTLSWARRCEAGRCGSAC